MPSWDEWMSNPPIAFMSPWLETWRRAIELSGDVNGIALFWDPRQMRRRWLADLSRIMDSYMRSPAFLELIQYNLKAMTQTALLPSREDAGPPRSDRV